MKSSTALAVLTTLATLTLPTHADGQTTGFAVSNAPWKWNAADTPIETFCAGISAAYGVTVFLEEGIDVTVSPDATPSKVATALKRILKPHRLHVHFDSMGIFITQAPIPYNVTHLAGDIEVQLAVPAGRLQSSHDDFSAKWVQGDSSINARWERIGDTSLAEAIEKQLKSLRPLYNFSHKPASRIINGKEYLAIGYRVPTTITHKGKTHKIADQEMVNDQFYFKNGDYMYTVSHSYPLADAGTGMAISKQLLGTIKWTQTSKYKRFGRSR